MTCVKHATDYGSSLPALLGSIQSCEQQDPTHSRGDSHSTPCPAQGGCLSPAVLGCIVCPFVHTVLYLLGSPSSPGGGQPQTPHLWPSWVASALPSDTTSLSGRWVRDSSHQPPPSTSVITAVLQQELIMSISCLKGQLQQRPITSVLPQGQLLQTTLHPLPSIALVKLKCLYRCCPLG